jgi:hypothetical protein
MSKNKNKGAAAQGASSPVAQEEVQAVVSLTEEQATSQESSTEAASVSTEVEAKPVVEKIPVWGKKDLEGKPQMMSLDKAMEKITNKGEVVKDPESGEDIHLLRIFRGRRVFYAKGKIQASSVTADVQEESATA